MSWAGSEDTASGRQGMTTTRPTAPSTVMPSNSARGGVDPRAEAVTAASPLTCPRPRRCLSILEARVPSGPGPAPVIDGSHAAWRVVEPSRDRAATSAASIARPPESQARNDWAPYYPSGWTDRSWAVMLVAARPDKAGVRSGPGLARDDISRAASFVGCQGDCGCLATHASAPSGPGTTETGVWITCQFVRLSLS